MAKAKPQAPELRDELQFRKVQARMKLRAAKAAEKTQKEFFSTYRAAERGRSNRDWRASAASADQSIIPDALVLNARARQCVRDSWVGKSAVKAFSRNVVGCGILPIPMARDAKGKPLNELNKRLLKLFWRWANDRKACDVEKRQSFWQKQNLMVEERVTVGENFLVWSYLPNPAGPVGLRLQSFESEQLDLRLQSFADPATGMSNQVRGGIEVDSFGAPVAYHFYTRNPTDYLPVNWKSIRITEARVIHYFKQERVMQTRGVTPLAPILQEVRDFNRFRDATLWRAIMEACIGMVITKDPAAGNILGLPPAPGDSGQTSSGMRTIDFTPGMVPQLLPGEKMDPYVPSSPGNQYEPYTKTALRGMGAGVGLSYSQIARQSESNYSAARQDMLEDRKEFEPEQEMLAHNVILDPIWSLFVRFAQMEGKLDDMVDGNEFAADPDRFCEAEYVAPAAPWIDPSNEANAYEKLLALRVMDREEVAALRGKRLSDIFDKIQGEQDDAARRGIDLPENKDSAQFKRDVIKAFIADGTVADVVANKVDFGPLIKSVGLPENKDYQEPLLPIVAQAGPLVNGEVIEDPEGDAVGGDVEAMASPPPAEGIAGNGGINGAAGGGKDDIKGAPGAPANNGGKLAAKNGHAGNGGTNGHAGKVSDLDLIAKREKIARRLATAKPLDSDESTQPPNYRDGDAAMACGTCSYLIGTECSKFEVGVEVGKVCDAWANNPVSRDDESGTKLTGPYKPDGEPAIDAIQSDFTENPAYNNPQGPAGISS